MHAWLKRGGSDYDYCARKRYTSVLRVTASPASRVVFYEFGHIDEVCTRASNIGTSKSTHTDSIVHTRLLSGLWHEEVYKNRAYVFDIKNKWKNRSCC